MIVVIVNVDWAIAMELAFPRFADTLVAQKKYKRLTLGHNYFYTRIDLQII